MVTLKGRWVSARRDLPAFVLWEVLQNECQHAWMAQGAWSIQGSTAACEEEAVCNLCFSLLSLSYIELAGNKELSLHFRVIHTWLEGVKMSAAADLREEWKVIPLGQQDSGGTAAVSSSCTQDGE